MKYETESLKYLDPVLCLMFLQFYPPLPYLPTFDTGSDVRPSFFNTILNSHVTEETSNIFYLLSTLRVNY